MAGETSLVTVLFTDIVGSTERAAELGNRAWRELLEAHHSLARREIRRCGGREVNTMGDGLLATFSRPAKGIRCAFAIRDAVAALGIQVRSGVHAGEVETVDETVGGIAVNTGARVAARAAPGEVLVSGTVRELVAGLGFTFEERGLQVLKGVPGEWPLFAVSALPAAGEAARPPGWLSRLPERRLVLPLGYLTVGLATLLLVLVLRYNLDLEGAVLGVLLIALVEAGALWRVHRSRRRRQTLQRLGFGGGTLLVGAVALGFAASPPDPPRILVLPFSPDSASVPAAADELSQGMARLLREQLAESAFLQPIPTLLVDQLAQDLGFGPEGPRTREDVARFFEASRARYLALVSVRPGAVGDSLDLELYESTAGWQPLDVLRTGSIASETLFEQVATFADDLKKGLPDAPLARFEREPELLDVVRTGASAYQDFLRGRQLYFFEDLPGARDALEEAIRADSTFALAHAWLARVYDRLFDPRAAAELAAARRFSGRAGERDRDFIAANELLVEKKYAELGRQLPRLVEKHAGDAEQLVQLGDMYRTLEKADTRSLEYWEPRLDLYARLVADEPQNPTLHKELGLLWAEKGDWQRAEAELTRVVTLNPYSADGYYNLGFLNRILGRYDRALEHFAAADSLRPGFAGDEVAFTLQELGRYNEARQRFVREIATPGADTRQIVNSHVWLAALSIETGDTATARAEIENAARLAGNANLGDEWLRQGILYQKAQLAWLRRDAGEVDRLASLMKEIHAENPEVHFVQGWGAFLKGDSAVAWRELDAAVENASQNAKATYLFELGEARRRAGQLREAETAYKQLLEMNPYFARGHYGLGMTYAALDRDAAGAKHLSRFLELWSQADSTLSEVRTARQMLETLGGSKRS